MDLKELLAIINDHNPEKLQSYCEGIFPGCQVDKVVCSILKSAPIAVRLVLKSGNRTSLYFSANDFKQFSDNQNDQ